VEVHDDPKAGHPASFRDTQNQGAATASTKLVALTIADGAQNGVLASDVPTATRERRLAENRDRAMKEHGTSPA
jgi:hypothetical protein